MPAIAPATRTSTAPDGPATVVADNASPDACVRSIQCTVMSAPMIVPSNPRVRMAGTAGNSTVIARDGGSPLAATTARTSAVVGAVALLSATSATDHRITVPSWSRRAAGRLARYIAAASATSATVRSTRSSISRARFGVVAVIG